MKNESPNLRESLWRRKLSAAERDTLRPEPELEEEARLTDVLRKIPDAPVPSNFNARLLDAIELAETPAASSQSWTLNWRVLWPRVAVVAGVLIFAGISLQWHTANSQRIALAKNIAMVAESRPVPSVEVLENLDAIQRMSRPAHADGELLAALQ